MKRTKQFGGRAKAKLLAKRPRVGPRPQIPAFPFRPAGGFGSFTRSPAVRSARVTGVEIKSVDMPAINAGADTISKTLSTTATLDLLNGVQEGASFYNRVGRRIHMKSIHVTGEIISSGNGTGVAEYNRILLVYDRQPNGAFPSIADILLDYGNDGTTFTSSFSKMNLNNVERFAILRDSRLAMPSNYEGAAAALDGGLASIMPYGESQNKINWFVKLKDLETHYKSTTNPAAIGDIATGALYLVTLGNVAAASAGFLLVYNARLRFTDV